jgi:predicted flap endonuclease-1-like 5' DNA nuclease
MAYLIGQLAFWLILTAAFAALAGWVYATQRAAAGEAKLRREREGLLRDLGRLAAGDSGPSDEMESSRELDSLRRLIEVRDGRIVELEGQLGQARGRADDAAGLLAETQRRIEGGRADNEELDRLRALVAEYETQRSREVDVIAAPVEEAAEEAPREDHALQTWRLRYFEQRVRYLEGLAAGAPTIAPNPDPVAAETPEATPTEAWRAREAEQRANFLEAELRRVTAPIDEGIVSEPEALSEEPPFAANADVDMLLRWRLLYLERRVAYLQADAVAEAPEPTAQLEPQFVADTGPDPDRWRWRARYLEARVRHLEQRPPQVIVQTVAAPVRIEAEDVAPALAPTAPSKKPPVLTSARHGAPDDLTLIEGVSPLQQSTLNAIGVFHFDQIAAWTPENVAWIERYFRLRGRVTNEEWVEQAEDLARDGVIAARRVLEGEDA